MVASVAIRMATIDFRRWAAPARSIHDDVDAHPVAEGVPCA